MTERDRLKPSMDRMHDQHAGMKAGRLVWLTLAMTAVVAALAWVWHVREPALLAERYAAQMPEVPAAGVEAHLRKIAELGDAGLPVLAAALANERPQVRDWARLVLLDEVNHWELLSAPGATEKLTLLTKALARSLPEMGPLDRKFAADLALRAMDWPHEAGSERTQLLADCESVLASAGSRSPRGIRSTSGSDLAANRAPPNRSHRETDIVLAGTGFNRLGDLPGGGLPIEPASMPHFDGFIEPHVAKEQAPRGAVTEPGRLPERIDGNPLGKDLAMSAAPGVNQPRRLPSTAVNPSNIRHLAVEVRGDVPTPNDVAAWHRLKPREVMRQLHVNDPRVVAAARVELEHRGVTGSLVEVARLATDPDPQVRKSLAEALPSLAGVDAKPWLLELSYDDDPQVRATAVTLMATSGDLELLKRLEQISREDPDDYTRAQAAKALPPRARSRE
jgi:hypothetical protein